MGQPLQLKPERVLHNKSRINMKTFVVVVVIFSCSVAVDIPEDDISLRAAAKYENSSAPTWCSKINTEIHMETVKQWTVLVQLGAMLTQRTAAVRTCPSRDGSMPTGPTRHAPLLLSAPTNVQSFTRRTSRISQILYRPELVSILPASLRIKLFSRSFFLHKIANVFS